MLTPTQTTNFDVADLLARELSYLKLAGRAHRTAREAFFFGDEDAAYDALTEAEAHTYAASLCAEEAAALLRDAGEDSTCR